MQRETMTNRSASLRNKLMLACAFVVAGVLATPAALAHDHHYRGHHDNSGKVIGALIVGAVIGGVIASASQHQDRYYDSGYYQQSYPQPAYYRNSYPAYSYGNGGYYPSRGYGSSVNVGVVYTSGGNRYYRDSHRYRDHGYYRDRHYRRGGRGHYYSRHDRDDD